MKASLYFWQLNLLGMQIAGEQGSYSVSHSIKSARRKFEYIKYRNLYLIFEWCVDFSTDKTQGRFDLGGSEAKDFLHIFMSLLVPPSQHTSSEGAGEAIDMHTGCGSLALLRNVSYFPHSISCGSSEEN